MVDSIRAAGLQGIQRGLEGAARHASELSQSFSVDSARDPVESIVGLKLDQLQVEASAKVIAVADSLSGSLLDILA